MAALFESATRITSPAALAAFALSVVIVGAILWRKGRGSHWAGLCVMVVGALIALVLVWRIADPPKEPEDLKGAQGPNQSATSSPSRPQATIPDAPRTKDHSAKSTDTGDQTSSGDQSPNVRGVTGDVNLTFGGVKP